MSNDGRAKLVPVALLAYARQMRHDPAPAEKKLWHCLRNRQLNNLKFRRQHPLGPFIADFYCSQAKLVVELDGDSHGDREDYDARRTVRLVRDGHCVIRFVKDDVYWHLDAVLEEILRECEMLLVPSPGTPGEGQDEGDLVRRNLSDVRNHPHPGPLPEYRERG